MSEGQQIETDTSQLTFSNLQQDDDWEGALIDEVPQPRLLSPEAQTISSILENCICQIEIAASLPVVRNIVHPSPEICEEFTRTLEVHQMLTEKLETSNGLQKESGGSPEEECAKRRRRAQLERDFKYSVRDLLRLFRTHPEAVMSFRPEVDTEIGEAEYTLILALKHFHGHMIVRLQTSPEEEILLAVETVSPDTDLIVKLEETAAAIKQKDVEISKKTDDLSILERRLQESQTEEVDWQLVADEQCQSLIKTSQADLELCQMDVEREEGECKRLEKPYADIEKEYNCIMEKRRLAEEKRVTELKLKVTLYCQSWWRGYCTRKALALNPIKPTKKGKKKGKGKGKGKGKKKK
ncbi:dynein regulatory complex protein 10 isoform X2 [Dunckerocampus dactyliophorus]|uniref:dynein regulatory complex protein 10 isoform X2 n=1 Tax=Dunckerocampus dactyliophorus TaxID=161453 RepID=UPI0024058DAE|nr:dynein regulatory complex protein 10 isoform X2 [Dunckerocampus dactyliophorus]